MTTVSLEVLDAAKAKLKDLSKDFEYGVCRGTCLSNVHPGSELVKPHSACHSWVSTAYHKICNTYDWDGDYKAKAVPFLTLSCHTVKRSDGICSPEAVKGIINWIAHESPFAKYVLNADDEASLANGVILLCGPGGLDHAQCMWICKILRYSIEGANALDTWLTLYQSGVNPLLSLVVATYVRHVKGATFGYTGPHSHSQVFGRSGWDYNSGVEVGSLFTESLAEKAADTFTVFKLKNLKDSVVVNPTEVLQKFCNPVAKDDGWGGKVTAQGADKDTFVSSILKWQKSLEEQIKPPKTAASITKETVYLDLDV